MDDASTKHFWSGWTRPVWQLVGLTIIYITLLPFVTSWRPTYLLTSVVIILAVVAYIRGWKSLWEKNRFCAGFYLACLALIVVFFTRAVVDYPLGKAEALHRGYGMGMSSGFLDKQYRFEHRQWYAEGGLGGGDALLWIYPNNAAVNSMAMIFGPPPGAYDGIYPTFEEAARALTDDPSEIRFSMPEQASIWLDDVKIEFTNDGDRWAFGRAHNVYKLNALRGGILEDSCALFGAERDGVFDFILAVSVDDGTVIANLYPP